MDGSLFHPSPATHFQMRSTGLPKLRTQRMPPPFPRDTAKSPFITKVKSLPSPVVNAGGTRRPSLTRTTSTPSTTTAPMFPDEVLDNLYISDLETARAVLSPNYASPGRPKVKYILTLLDSAKEQPQVFIPSATENNGMPEHVLKLIKISDLNEVNLLEILPEACAFIREALKNNDGGVLVHCRKGVSRSGGVIVAYLMQELQLDFARGLHRARQSRSKICPNRSFGEQLQMWKDLEYTLRDETGAEKPLYRDWKDRTKFRPILNL